MAYLRASQQVLDAHAQSTESRSEMQCILPCIMFDADFYAILGPGKYELKETRHIQSSCNSGVNNRYTGVALLLHDFRFRYLVSTKSSLCTLEFTYLFICLFMGSSHYSSATLGTKGLGAVELCNEIKPPNYPSCCFQRLSICLSVFLSGQVLPRKQLWSV